MEARQLARLLDDVLRNTVGDRGECLPDDPPRLPHRHSIADTITKVRCNLRRGEWSSRIANMHGRIGDGLHEDGVDEVDAEMGRSRGPG